MRAILATSVIGAALVCGPQILHAAPPADTPDQQQAMGPVPPAAKQTTCAGNPDALGIARVVEIDTTGGPGFGFEHYKAYDFLNPKEVVLTFDDGPLSPRTDAILDALAAHCTKATFFMVGKQAGNAPEMVRAVAQAGHTVGSHTVTHPMLNKLSFEKAKDEIEKSISIISRAAGAPMAPFFRYPGLRDTPETLKHLSERNIAVFSTDIDSLDYKRMQPSRMVSSVMEKLEKRGKGIILMHDINPRTAKAVPDFLKQLKAKGYKIVHLTAKAPVVTLKEYDVLIEKDVKGLSAGTGRPMTSVVRTISGGQ